MLLVVVVLSGLGVAIVQSNLGVDVALWRRGVAIVWWGAGVVVVLLGLEVVVIVARLWLRLRVNWVIRLGRHLRPARIHRDGISIKCVVIAWYRCPASTMDCRTATLLLIPKGVVPSSAAPIAIVVLTE